MAVKSKSETPSNRVDVAAFVLFATGLLVAACALFHLPGDDGTQHPLGSPGAWLAEGLFDSLGFAVYVMLAGWAILSLTLFLKPPLTRWLTRLVGWLLLLPCSAVAFDQIGDALVAPAVAGGGGAVGAGLSHAMISQLPLAARIVAFAACTALGLYLAADTVLIFVGRRAARLLGLMGRMGRMGLMRLRRLFAARPKIDRAPRVQPVVVAERDVPISRSNAEVHVEGPPAADYELPPTTLLEDPEPFPHELHDSHLRETAALLEKTFTDLGLNVRVVGIHTGPVITQYEVALETGLRVNKVTVLGDDLALNLKVPSVRIVAPIPGKNTVGIEVPNEHRAVVRIKELIVAAGPKLAKSRLPLFLGKDTEGRPLVYDLAEMPHLLIAGRTGTGKSVCLNAVILSLLLTRRPDECRMIMIDPKQVEFSDYQCLPHLMCPVVTQNSKAEAILAWAVDKMEERYSLLARLRCRNIGQYNGLPYDEILNRVRPAHDEEKADVPEKMPYIVIIIDEIGDLMMEMKKEVEGHIIRLAQKSRAAGIHLILATQRPTVDVITGLIKSNLPARICFQVSSRSDSRVVLDENGADKLLGKGDMLFLQPGTSTLVRAQGAYASDQEIQRVVGHLECDPDFVPELLELKARNRDGEGGGAAGGAAMKARDPLYEQAVEVIVREGRGSVSLLQRALGIGYGKAARFIDYMAEDGVVGHYNGSQAREVLITMEQWEEMQAAG
jgi:S-DNA-T family DNA segregation ATPase FtsK/SpoIIIE